MATTLYRRIADSGHCHWGRTYTFHSYNKHTRFGVDVDDYTMQTKLLNIPRRTWMYLVEMEHHVVAELAGAEQLALLGDLEAVGHRDGVKHLTGRINCGSGGIVKHFERAAPRQTGRQQS